MQQSEVQQIRNQNPFKQQNKSQKLRYSSLNHFNQQNNIQKEKPLTPGHYIQCLKTTGVYRCQICQSLKKICPYSSKASKSFVCKNNHVGLQDKRFSNNATIYHHHQDVRPNSNPKPVITFQQPKVQHLIQQQIYYPVYHNNYVLSESRKNVSINPQGKSGSRFNSSNKKRRLNESTFILSIEQILPPKQLRKLTQKLMLQKQII